MFIRTWKKGSKSYAAVVKNTRVKDKVNQEIVAYLGEVTDDQIPYLKAAYAKVKPRLVYNGEYDDCDEKR